MTNILITSASRKVSLVKSFKKVLENRGGKVVVGDSSPFSASFFFADEFCLLPPDYSSDFLNEILEICGKHKISLIIPTRDEELPIFSENKELLEKAGVKVMVADKKIIEICQDKIMFSQFCQENGFDCPKTYSLLDIKNNNFKFPLFLNEKKSKASKNAFKANNKEELDFYIKTAQQPIIQEYITAKEYTVDLFADFDGKVISVVPRERIKVFGGESFVSKTFKNQEIINKTMELAEKLGLVGHNTIQCFFDGKTVKFIEVNPRYGGGANLSFEAGANTPEFLIKIIEGEKVNEIIGDFKDDLVMLRYTDDFFIDENKITKI